jgi:hypothetical protein
MHFVREISDHVDDVIGLNDSVPELNQRPIMLFNRVPRPIAETQNVCVPEV